MQPAKLHIKNVKGLKIVKILYEEISFWWINEAFGWSQGTEMWDLLG